MSITIKGLIKNNELITVDINEEKYFLLKDSPFFTNKKCKSQFNFS